VEWAPVGNDNKRALVARMCPLGKLRMRRAWMRGKGRRRIGQGADAWDRARTPRADATAGADSGSECGRDLNCAQPLRYEYMSRREQVEVGCGPEWARTRYGAGACNC
jgi:hypothetical protein